MRRFVFPLVLTLVSMLVAACGAAPAAPASAPTAAQSAQATAAPAAAVVATAAPAAPGTIVVYNTPPEWANWGTVLKEFQTSSGVTIPPDNKNSGQTLAQLVAEQDRPVADAAYFGVTFGIEATERGLLTAYKPANFDAIPAELKDAEGRWFAIHTGTVAFIVNTQALGSTPVPQSWADLLKPEYRGKIGLLDPSSAFIGYAAATAANLALGGSLENWDPAVNYFTQLKQQDLIIPKQTATPRVLSGEIPILIDTDFNGYRLKYRDNGPIEVVIPQEGSLTIPYVIGLVNNGPNPEQGRKLLDYVLSDEGQRLWADGFVRPIRAELMSAETQARFLPASDYARARAVNYQQMATAQAAFTERWTKDVAP
ncbi:MAG: extracellular solute-binding protein [Chloroflexaceae bacterium]|jgi:putative spermidine/putrescine transport system substrate-binding protein|nr:extracellular solute-binding protein [Chloroflexaceae bacterium]